MAVHIYTDGSRNPAGAGAGFARLHQHSWTGTAFSLAITTTSSMAELTAFERAMEEALATAKSNLSFTRVCIHTDSQATLTKIKQVRAGKDAGHVPAESAVAGRILRLEREIWCEAVDCEFRWVLAHSGDVGNDKADRLARYGANQSRLSGGVARSFANPDLTNFP